MSAKQSWERHDVSYTPERGAKSNSSQHSVLDATAESPKENSHVLDGEQVREQLDRILTSAVFRNSKRYASVLKYVVDQTLGGKSELLKERTIGTEVFGRAHDYDTGSDHAVRSAVAEVRKRLAQYYQEDDTSGELRIEIQPGSYIPQFRVATLLALRVGSSSAPAANPAITTTEDPTDPAILPRLATKEASTGISPAFKWILYVLVPVLLVAALVLYPRAADPFESFWGPVLTSPNPILLCVGNLAGRQSIEDMTKDGRPMTVLDFHMVPSQTVHIDDAMTLSRIAGFMQARGKQFRVASQADATLTDLQNGPSVLIGLANNDWTERLVGKLRFTVEHPSPTVIAIVDHSNPSNRDWSMDYSKPFLDVTKDYALALRVTDPKTDQMVVAVAGITVFGTMAAGEFLTNPEELRRIEVIAPPGWKHKNLELVLATDVVRGKPGRATIIASQFW